MDGYLIKVKYAIALLLVGSAMSLSSCGGGGGAGNVNTERLMTLRSDSLTMIESQNGIRKNIFKAPLVESYGLAREPYSEYRMGIFAEMYRDTSALVQTTIRADYAINYEKRRLWEARGNVVATGADGQKLYTEQLFWDQRTERIYSNVRSRVIQGNEVFDGEGFESDQSFENWMFRDGEGQIELYPDPIVDSTSTSTSTVAGSGGNAADSMTVSGQAGGAVNGGTVSGAATDSPAS